MIVNSALTEYFLNVMVAVRDGCVCVCGWVVGGGCDVIFNITEEG